MHWHANGLIYEGEWKDNNRTGKGKFTWSKGDMYEGELKDNIKNTVISLDIEVIKKRFTY